MSWFSDLANQALQTAQKQMKQAQKQIDKVLDIDEQEKAKAKSAIKSGKSASVSTHEDEETKEDSNSWSSWSSWMTPKSADSGEKAETAGTSQSAATASSWNFSWGSQQESSSTSESSPLSSSARSPASMTKKASSAEKKLGLTRSDRQKKNISEKASSLISKTDPQKEDESKPVKQSERLGFVEGEKEDRLCEEKKDVEPVLEEDTVAGRVGILGDGNSSASELASLSQDSVTEKVEKEVSETRTSLALSSETVEDTGVSEPFTLSSDKNEDTVVNESLALSSDKNEDTDVSESLALSSDKHVDTVVSECEPSIESGQFESKSVMGDGDSAYSGKDGKANDKETEQESPEQSEGVSLVTESEREQSEVDSSQNQESAGDGAGEACEPGVSNTSSSSQETFEAIPKEDGREVISENYEYDMTTNDQGSETVGRQSPDADSALSRDSSFAHISFSDNAQVESVTSICSEPTLLTLSTEDKDSSSSTEEGLPNVSPFSPPSHSSLTLEEEDRGEEDKEIESSNPETFTPQVEQSPVSSPPLDSTATVSSNDSSETSRLDSSADTLVDRCQESEGEKGTEEGEGGQHWLEDSSLAGLEAAASPSASFVEGMIEDAMGMEDPSKQEDSGSDHHSEEKSESSKVDSEFEKSVYSGHESSDEIETTTSSDIEIISTPTPNGEKNIVDLSPLRFSLPKPIRSHGPGHQRTDSTDSSTNSKGEGEQLSPERDSDHDRHDWHREGKGPGQQQDSAVQQEDMDNPQHPQRLLKKLAEMAEVLQARERQLVQLSKDNNDLLETNSILRSQLQQAEEAREAEMTDVHALTDEFTRRMGEAERKIQTILKEKEAVKEQLQVAQRELASRSADVNLEAVLAEKDEQIAGLLEEGEKLSKQQLQNSTIIKKLRAKEKENEKLLSSQKKKLEQQKEELDRLKVVLDSKEDMEKKQADAIKQLNAAVQLIEKEKAKLKVEVDSSEEKIRGLQSTLDSSYKEIAELHKNNASQDSRAQQAALSAEMQVREELKMAMEQESQRHRQEKEALVIQIEDLRMTLARMEKEQNRREEMLKQEISDLQMRLQEDESRSQDLTQSVTSATRPLLRQIENLQATHSMQSTAWEKVERNLTERLSEAQTSLALAQEKERAATEKLTEATSRCTALESSNSLLRQEKAQLGAQQDSDRRRIDLLEERKAHDVAQLELAKQKLSEEVAALRKDKVFLESQLETERSRLESEKQRVAVAEEQIRILERERPKSRGTPSPVSVSRQESITSSFSERSSTPTWLPKPEEIEGQFMSSHGAKVSLYDSMRQSGAASLMENLQSQLKLREGEIVQLQADIQQLERTRESMARELVNLTNLNEELQEEVKELPKMRTQFTDLDARYNALLQMYGEKEERVQELMLDLADVKEMYKQQISSLLK
ncbi:uncharacterized protein LOC143276311 isoform X2 [Babylonia areolata]|uniref:uncharacterized protein LOC143276311 isoform X2 n=1 Tax=Babylonia areolata TaxID=304850 RepID=UPI003FD33298